MIRTRPVSGVVVDKTIRYIAYYLYLHVPIHSRSNPKVSEELFDAAFPPPS